jgi:general secretion pathway protein K
MTRAFTACWTFLTRERSLRPRAIDRARPQRSEDEHPWPEEVPAGRGRAIDPARPRRRRRRQRGVAIITVLIAISLTLVLTNQFSTTTSIDLIAAANYRDQIRAHFLARSAVNLTEIVIRLQQKLDGASNQKGFEGLKGVQITEFANQLMLAFCGSAQEVRAAVGDAAAAQAKGLGADIGTCGVVGAITTDDDKVNLNCANAAESYALTTKSALDALLFFNAYDPLFEEADAENWRRDRDLQVAALIDYIDGNNIRGVNQRGTTEDYGYESLKDHYRPKNTYLDTVGELKLVRGVDDRFWTLFGSALTVYGGCKLNLSAVSNVQLLAAILYLSVPLDKKTTEPMLQDPQKLFALAGLVAKAKQFGMQFQSVDDFIKFVKDPCAAVGSLAGDTTLQGSQAQAAVSQGIPGCGTGVKLGMDLDKKSVDQLARTGPRRTYRVEAWGEIDRPGTAFPPIRSTITGVWDTKVQNQNQRKASTATAKGTWVFLRED